MASGDSLLVFDPLSNRPPTANYATVDLRSGFVVLDFDDTTDEKAQFHAVVPSHYGGGNLLAELTWTSSAATTGNAQWRVEITRLNQGANLDTLPAVAGSSDVLVAAPAASGDLITSLSSSLTPGGLTTGDLLLVQVTRLAADAADTLVGDIELVALEIREV